MNKYNWSKKEDNLEECDQILRDFDQGIAFNSIATSLSCDHSWGEAVIDAAKDIKSQIRYLTSKGRSRLYPTASTKLAPTMISSAVELKDCVLLSKKLANLSEEQAGQLRWAADYLFRHKQHWHNYLNFRCTKEFQLYLLRMSPVVNEDRWLFKLAPLRDTQPAFSRWTTKTKITRISSSNPVRDGFKFPDGQARLYFLKSNAVSVAPSSQVPVSSQTSNALQYVLHLYAILKKAEKIMGENHE